MKILVLNGSPKKDKSDTMHITRAFLDGMNEATPQEVHTIHVIDKHIAYCTGCFSCMRNGGECIYDDDMRKILNEILESDLLIWSFPLYCYGMPAPLKCMSFHHNSHNESGQYDELPQSKVHERAHQGPHEECKLYAGHHY